MCAVVSRLHTRVCLLLLSGLYCVLFTALFIVIPGGSGFLQGSFIFVYKKNSDSVRVGGRPFSCSPLNGSTITLLQLGG